jgi:hypothetical protein
MLVQAINKFIGNCLCANRKASRLKCECYAERSMKNQIRDLGVCVAWNRRH